MPWWNYPNHQIPRGHTYMGTKRLVALPPRYGDPFIEEETEEEVEEEENG